MVLGRPLRVLLAYRSDVDVDGGAANVMNGTAAGLRTLGVDVDITFDIRPDVSAGYDLVHTFNWWKPETAREQMRHVRALGLPLVWQPIYLRQSECFWAIMASRAVFNPDRSEQERESLLDAFAAGTLQVEGFDRWTPNGADLESAQHVRDMAQLADHIFCCSHHEAQGLFQAARLTSKSFSVVPHGVDQRIFGSATPRAFRSYLGSDDEYVLCVGSVDGRKNQLFLVEALRGSGRKIVLVGPSYAPEYLSMIRQRGGEDLVYFDRLPQQLVASAYAGARVHALASYTEGSALASMEAATAGCPIVVSNRSSEFEYYGELAYYCEPTSVASIRDAVLCAWETCSTEPHRQSALRERMQKYTWETAAAATLEAYERILRNVANRGTAQARRAAGTAEARAFACLVDYDVLIAHPDLLSVWAETFTADDPATLVVYAPGVSPSTIEQQLQPLLGNAAAADVLALAPPAAADRVVAAGVDGILSLNCRRSDLRELAESVWRAKQVFK